MNADARTEQTEFRGSSFAIAGWHALRLGTAEIAQLRKQPLVEPLAGIAPPSLKHSDEQTVASFAAVCAAIRTCDLAAVDFSSWGIVASTRFIGRGAVTGTIDKFASEGAWGVSMQLTPHYMVHSTSSTLSLALQCHGPCIGAGGGPIDETSAVLAAIGLLQSPHLEGVWLVFSGWEPEPTFDNRCMPSSNGECTAAALALLRTQPAGHESGMHIHPQSAADRGPQARNHPTAGLIEWFGQVAESPSTEASLLAELGGGLRLQFELRPALSPIGQPLRAVHAGPHPTPAPHFPLGIAAPAETTATHFTTTQS